MTPAPLPSVARQWTPKEDEQLRSLIVGGRTPAEIAIKLRRSVGAVYARAHRFRLSFKRVKARKSIAGCRRLVEIELKVKK
jgi:DNA-directed RNA polymerase specialized sigma24 family protein